LIRDSNTTLIHTGIHNSFPPINRNTGHVAVTEENEFLNSTMRQKKRISHIRTICTNHSVKNNISNRFYEDVLIRSDKYKFSMCTAAKVGSTFLIQFMTVLEKGIEYGKALFQTERKLTHMYHAHDFLTSRKWASHERTVLVARDPYSRLFSAYIDKIYLPIWFETSQRIRERYSNKNESNCQTLVTFEEFLKHIIHIANQGIKPDRHWAQISATCHPCELNAFLLVKQESFAEDIAFVLKSVNATAEERDVIDSAMKNKKKEWILPGLIATIYDYAKEERVQHCLGWRNVAKRVWESFKFQGYIRSDIPFPFNGFTANTTYQNATVFSQFVIETIVANPLTSTESRQQRQAYLCEAYQTISNDTISALKKIYRYDFLVYDYSTTPPCW